MNCAEMLEILIMYATQTASKEQRSAVELHTKKCSPCQAELDAIIRLTDDYRALGETPITAKAIENLEEYAGKKPSAGTSPADTEKAIIIERVIPLKTAIVYIAAGVLAIFITHLLIFTNPDTTEINSGHKLIQGFLTYVDEECNIVRISPESPLPVDIEIGNIRFEKTLIHLSDNTKMWVAPMTSFRVVPSQDERKFKIELNEGKVQCAVTKGLGKFKVMTKAGEITVLGTEFVTKITPSTVDAGDQKASRHDLGVTVLEGKVNIVGPNISKTLESNQSARNSVISTSAGIVPVDEIKSTKHVKPIVLNSKNYKIAADDDEDAFDFDEYDEDLFDFVILDF